MTPDAMLPLADLVVIDLTVARAGPTAVRQLADWGADVIRIEPPDTSIRGQLTADFLNLHRNKRALALDLKTEAGRSVLHEIVAQADVLVENMRPRVKRALTFDWETVSALNPRLIMGSISGFGQTGPYAERGGVDQIAQGLSGMMSVTGHPGQGPVRAGAAVSDMAAGLQLAVGILVALHERERTGVGRWVHTSLVESMIGMLDFQAARWTVDREVPPQAGNDHPTLRPMGLYPTADGYLNVAAAWGALWTEFCKAIDRAELLTDSRFASPTDRVDNHDELTEIINAALSSRSTAEWVDVLNAVGVPAGAVNNMAAAFEDVQVQHLGVEASVHHPLRGDIGVVRNAATIEGIDSAIQVPSPVAGQHSRNILEQFGLPAEKIDELVLDGVVTEWAPEGQETDRTPGQ